MYKSKTIIATSILSTISVNSLAITKIPTIIVTNSRFEQNIDTVNNSVTVISTEDIVKSQATNLLDLLAKQVGVDITRSGGTGQQSSMFLRGTSGSQVLVLIDGVRVASAVDGTFSWNNLDLESIDKIEIVRGGKSSLYGSDAIGGVIQIFTKRHEPGYSFKTTLGSNYLHKQSLYFNLNKSKFGGSISANMEAGDSFSATNTNSSNYNPDTDKYSRQNIGINAWYNPTNKLKISASSLYNYTNADYDQGRDKTTTNSEIKNISTSIDAEFKINPIWTSDAKIAFAEHHYDTVVIPNSMPQYKSKTYRTQLTVNNIVKINSNLNTIFGYNYVLDKSSISNKDVTKTGLYANINYDNNRVSNGLTVRRSTHSQYGTHYTYGIDLGYSVKKYLYVAANYNTSFVSPNMLQMYSEWSGNKNLKPEESNNWELTAKYKSNNTNVNFSYFNNRITNNIIYSSDTYKFKNEAIVNIKGIEIAAKQRIKYADINANITYQNVNDADGKRLLRRPDFKLNIGATKEIFRYKLALNYQFVSDRSDLYYDTSFVKQDTTLKSYHLLSAGVKYEVAKKTIIGFKINNITNSDYKTAYGYNSAGRSYYITAEYKSGL